MTLFELHTYLKHAGFSHWGVSPARLYSKNEQDQTPLDFLCEQFSIEGLKALAITNYQFNNKDAYSGLSPSLKVIISENEDTINLLDVLFENGIDVNATDDHGNNALHLSNERSLKQEALYLISQGIDFTKKNEKSETPFDLIPEAAEVFMVPALNKAIKSQKKHGFAGLNAISSLFNGNPVFSKPKKASK